MKELLRKGITVAVFAAATAVSGTALAAPVAFNISGATLGAAGGGYGSETNRIENSADATLLEVYFSTTSFPGIAFNLNPGQTSSLFNFGRVQFAEPNAGTGIVAAEQDDLGVKAIFTFTQPGVGSQTVTALGSATVGAINDPGNPNAVDYQIDWAPLLVSFGTGGSFRIDLTDLNFTTRGFQDASATITLISDSTPVPEPSSLALAGLGLLAVAGAKRRRKN